MPCALAAGIDCVTACSGGGTVIVAAGVIQRCDSNDRSHGIAAMAMRSKASRMGSLFFMAPICRICRIFQRFVL
jgi:hypothetical protein